MTCEELRRIFGPGGLNLYECGGYLSDGLFFPLCTAGRLFTTEPRGKPHSRWTTNKNKMCTVLDIVKNYGSQISRWPSVILASYPKFGIKCNVAVGI